MGRLQRQRFAGAAGPALLSPCCSAMTTTAGSGLRSPEPLEARLKAGREKTTTLHGASRCTARSSGSSSSTRERKKIWTEAAARRPPAGRNSLWDRKQAPEDEQRPAGGRGQRQQDERESTCAGPSRLEHRIKQQNATLCQVLVGKTSAAMHTQRAAESSGQWQAASHLSSWTQQMIRGRPTAAGDSYAPS